MKSDAVTFTSLLRGCLASEDGVREASKVMEQMRRSEAVPDMRLYNRAMEVSHTQGHEDIKAGL